jgi:hypothetical protein
VSGSGWLTASQLETLMADVAAQAPALEGMDPAFLPHYAKIAARKLLFFHGSKRPAAAGGGGGGGRVVRLADLAASPVMLELQVSAPGGGGVPGRAGGGSTLLWQQAWSARREEAAAACSRRHPPTPTLPRGCLTAGDAGHERG